MVRVNGVYWTADFTISRALSEAYRASGKDKLLYFCVGDPDRVSDRLGPNIGTELLKYYPHVIGTNEEPVLTDDMLQMWSTVTQKWPDAFVIGIEASGGPEESIGFVEISSRGIRRRPEHGEAPAWICDVGIAACLWVDEAPIELTPAEYNRSQRVADAIVDGQIRFLQRVKKYEPDL